MSKQTKKPWQGRFTESTNEFVEEFTASIKFDQILAIYDIRCSLAHAEMLASEGIILEEEGSTIIKGLKSIEKDIKNEKPAESNRLYNKFNGKLKLSVSFHRVRTSIFFIFF